MPVPMTAAKLRPAPLHVDEAGFAVVVKNTFLEVSGSRSCGGSCTAPASYAGVVRRSLEDAVGMDLLGAGKASLNLSALGSESDEAETETTAASTPTRSREITWLWPATPTTPALAAKVQLSLVDLVGQEDEEPWEGLVLPAAPTTVPPMAPFWAAACGQDVWMGEQPQWYHTQDWGQYPLLAWGYPTDTSGETLEAAAGPPPPLGSPKLPADLEQSLLDASRAVATTEEEAESALGKTSSGIFVHLSHAKEPKWDPPASSPTAASGGLRLDFDEQACAEAPAFASSCA